MRGLKHTLAMAALPAIVGPAVLALSAPACGAVTGSGPNGFNLVETVHVAAAPSAVYAALITPGRWWSASHTFSHDPANLTLDARAGGCWCEALASGGSAEHLTVVNVAPGRLLRLRGALGPMQGMPVEGVMTWTMNDAEGGTDLQLTYAIGGYSADGFSQLSGLADGVLGEQVRRLKAYVETGKPEPKT